LNEGANADAISTSSQPSLARPLPSRSRVNSPEEVSVLKMISVLFAIAVVTGVPALALAQGDGTGDGGVLPPAAASSSPEGTSASAGTGGATTGAATGGGTTAGTGGVTGGVTGGLGNAGTSSGTARAVEPVSVLFGGAGLVGAALLRRALRK